MVHPVQLETVISAIKGGCCQPPTPVLNIWKPVPSATEHASTYLLHFYRFYVCKYCLYTVHDKLTFMMIKYHIPLYITHPGHTICVCDNSNIFWQ